MPQDLIVFGEDWGGHPSSTQHLIKRLAREYSVTWMNSIGMRRPQFNQADIKRAFKKGLSLYQNRSKCNDQVATNNITVMNPKAVPWPANKWARMLNQKLLTDQIRNELNERGVKSPLLWLSLPTAVDVVGRLGERAVIYYCGDDFSALSGVDHEPVSQMEQELVEKADLILAASKTLANKFPKEKTFFLPHGADVEAFQKPHQRPNDLPQGRPIIGFYGSLSEWVDTELIETIALKLHNWDVVLIGREVADMTRLKRLSNVYFLGEKQHEELSAYVQHWNISMLPFRDNAQIRACNPLKLREYLSAGRPIVTTDFPALDGYRELVHVAHTEDEFLNAIVLASLDMTPSTNHSSLLQVTEWESVRLLSENTAQRKRRVEKESWEHRANELQLLLASL